MLKRPASPFGFIVPDADFFVKGEPSIPPPASGLGRAIYAMLKRPASPFGFIVPDADFFVKGEPSIPPPASGLYKP
ncbi:hypothetical protein, partial [Phormidium sp. CCY1219]|uniref:hypothetical protein n=1 Tax=Phormidium sp. CCY1219 TaxID=2886104 RepID=UPI002D1EBEC3